ncbi:helix-turn-helix transcriptional regulator [Anaerotruncus colihominis]|uniref:helix-turn-helix domain-containing protein n=1 Tax=Anaerotruncus colihominis TaxID=169435 RepID=UPI0026EBCB1B|nr:helix-turn-helix transcriptional regulator [Anaerotruncus colihominis]
MENDGRKKATTYTLREIHSISHSTVQRLQKNLPVSTYTLDRLCKILDCRLDEVAEYMPDEAL